MADISRIKLSNGDIFNIKDEVARKGLEELLGIKYSEEEDTADSEEE